uniref:MFS transporter n=1 Tax=Gluconobacter thailandicus TaxID=257438 RepID=UPI0018D33A31|nr:MFS transporter [Gluconobacter thailandicus]
MTLACQLGLLMLAIGITGYAKTALSPVQEAVKTSLSLSDNSISLLQGLALALPVMIGGTPIGALVDRCNRVKLIRVLLVLSLFALCASALLPTYATLFLGRMLIGLTVGGMLPAVLSISADLFSTGVRGRVNMLLGFGPVFGVALAFGLGGSLLTSLHGTGVTGGWRGTLLVMTAPVLMVLAASVFMREPVRQETDTSSSMSLRKGLLELRRYAPFIAPLSLGMLIVSMADTAAGVWAAPILERQYHLSAAIVGKMLGGVMLLGGLLGVIAGGFLTDLLHKLRGERGVLLIAIDMAALSILGAAFPLVHSATVFAALLTILLIAGGAMGIAVLTLFTLAIPNELRGFAIGLVSAGGTLIATGIAPSTVSLLSSFLQGPSALGEAMTIVGMTGSLTGTIALVMAGRSISKVDTV